MWWSRRALYTDDIESPENGRGSQWERFSLIMEETNVHGVSKPQPKQHMQGDKVATAWSTDCKAGDKVALQ